MKNYKILFYVTTGLLTLLMSFSISMYLFQADMIQGAFKTMGYPIYLVYPLAFAKFLGLVTLWFIKSDRLKTWAYAGFFFNALLAFFAHYMIGDGEQFPALLVGILALASYYSYTKLPTVKS